MFSTCLRKVRRCFPGVNSYKENSNWPAPKWHATCQLTVEIREGLSGVDSSIDP
jgi:hypothetical protein